MRPLPGVAAIVSNSTGNSTHFSASPPRTIPGLHSFYRHLVQALLALIACENPLPSAASTQEALSAIHENLRELDALCRAASAPFVSAESLQELEAQRGALAEQATANNVRAFYLSRALR